MKKAILFTLVASLLLSSCKKEHSGGTKPTNGTYKINLNVSGFTQSVVTSATNKTQVNDLKTAAVTGIGGFLDQLYYYVFDSNGKLVHFLSQDSTASNFGAISDNLPAGTYTVVIGAGKKGFNTFSLSTSLIPQNGWYFSYNPSPYAIPLAWLDTFYDKFQLTVSGDVNQTVQLNRIVGQLGVVIQDTIPASANTIVVTITQEDYALMFFPTEKLAIANTLVNTITLPAAVKGTNTFTTTNIIGNTATPITVEITCFDAAKNILGSVTVNNVSIQKNTETILTGKLFGSANGFNVSLGAWTPGTITIPYSGYSGSKQTN